VSFALITHEYDFTLAYAPGNSSSMILVNDQFPGPTIRVNVHDLIVVHIHNALQTDEEVTIHFHGMLQRQTPQMDGVGYVTQMPIPRGQTFTHRFHAYPAGTHMYHSHAGLQAITTFGALIVDDPFRPWRVKEAPSGPLMLSDRWEGIDRLRQEQELTGSPFQWPGEPTDILINGQKSYVLTLDPNRKYLLRLIGAVSLSTVAFGIHRHPMTVVEVDGKLIVPKENVTSIEIASGQRYAVIIETHNSYTGVFAMQASIRWRVTSMDSSALGILRYGLQSTIPSNFSSLVLPSLSNETEFLRFAFNERYQTLLAAEKMPQGTDGHPDLEIILVTSQEYYGDGKEIRWMANNGTLDMLRLKNLNTSLLLDLDRGIEEHLPHDVVYTLQNNQLVDIVVQNTVALNGVCESHPMHLHGHKFWIHSYGVGQYNPATNIWPDRHDPVLRDSLMVYASSFAYFTPNRTASNHRTPCGWTKLRMIADNPGLWMFHCHIGAHASMGMNVLLKEDIDHLSLSSFI
jgi:L-ascorbate oxidase